MKKNNFSSWNLKKKLSLYLFFLFFIPGVLFSKTYSSNEDQLFVEGEIYIKIKDNSSVILGLPGDRKNPVEINSLYSQYKVSKTRKPFTVFRNPKFDRIYKITFNENDKVEDFIKELELIPYIQFAEKVPFYSSHQLAPNDPSVQNGDSYQLELINAYDLFELHPGDPANNSAGSLIAIVDNAILITHEDLTENFIIGRDVADSDDDPNPPNNSPPFGHGTRVAGIACGRTNNSIGIASMGWNNRLMAVKCRSDNGPLNYMEGVAWAAANGAEIINMSWGGVSPSEVDYLVMVEAKNSGSLLVSSAGNSGNSAPNYPAAYGEGTTNEPWEVIDRDLVIAVASIDPNGDRSAFSSFGNWVDVAAYGTDIYTCSNENNSSYTYNNLGTSYAAPLVSGLLGLMKSYAPNVSNEDLLNCILNASNTDIYDQANHPNNIPGSLGSGRIDALTALLCIKPNCLNPLAVISPSSATICPNENIELRANEGIGYLWSTGETTRNITISQPGSYSLTVTFNGGCNASTSINITPSLSTPIVIMTDGSGNIVDENSICVPSEGLGFSFHLSAFWGSSYLWDNGSTISTHADLGYTGAIPYQLTPYSFTPSVTITDVGGCIGVEEEISLQYDFFPNPEIEFSFEESSGFENDGWLCENENANVTITAVTNEAYNPTYIWSTGATTNSINVSPTVTSSYVVSITNEFGCVSEKEVEVAVFPCPNNTCICTGNNTFDFGIDDGQIHNISQLSGVPTTDVFSSKCISIKGRVRFDLEFNNFRNSIIHLSPGAELIVPDGETLTFSESILMGCDAMWKGISVETGGRLELWNSTIRDAQYAVTAYGESTLQIMGSTFDRNFVGIFVPPPTAASPNVFNNQINQDFNAPLFFSGNNYLCSGGLKPAYLGQSPSPGNVSFAGLLLSNVNFFQVGFPQQTQFQKATFDGLRNGIISYNTALEIRADIQNLVGENIGGSPFTPSGVGDYSHSGIGVFLRNSNGFQMIGSSIENAFKGIYARYADLDNVSKNTFTNVNTGIEIIKNEGKSIIIKDNDFYCDEGGIIVMESDRCDIQINKNNVYRAEGSTNPMVGIGIYNSILDIKGSGNIADDGGVADIYQNHVELKNPNTTTIDKGIEIMNSSFVKVKSNTVYEQGSPGEKHLFSLLGNYGSCQLRNNTGFNATSPNTTSKAVGLNIMNNTNTIYCCNTFSELDQAIRFSGMADDTRLLGNSFFNINSRGLLLGSGTTIGVQGNPSTDDFLPGNRWSLNGGGAEHQGNQLEVEDSRIFFDPNINLSYPDPDPIPNQGWFVPDPNMTNPTPTLDCFATPDCAVDEVSIIGTGPIDEVDIKIATGKLSKGLFGGGVLWEGRRYLYRKLKQNNQLLGQNTAIDNFHIENTNSILGQFFEIDKEIGTLYHIDNSLVPPIIAKRQIIKDLLYSIQEKDIMITTTPKNLHPTIWVEKQLLLDQFAIVNEELNILLDGFKSEKQNSINTILSKNNNVNTETIFEQNIQIVNETYLNTLVSVDFDFDATQLQAIETIANQCPLYGGNVVFRARGMLKAVGDNTYYDDEQICNGAAKRKAVENKKSIIASNSLTIFPNPANTNIHIILNSALETAVDFVFYDVSGKLIEKFVLPIGEKEHNINVTHIPKGVYFYECRLNDEFYKGKVILMK